MDNYFHNNRQVIYVQENIPGPKEDSEEYEILINTFNSQLTVHCECAQKCDISNCICLIKSGGSNYTCQPDMSWYTLDKEKDFNTFPIIECNSLCRCSNNCGNRLVQGGPIDSLIVKPCDNIKGLGLFTRKNIPEGSFICEYAGEVLTKLQALKRYDSNKAEGKMNYIYCLNEHSSGKCTQTFIDPSTFGNIGRYINHSCEPNCFILPVRVDSPTPKLAIFSCVEILPDNELTFDYGTFNSGHVKDVDLKKCLCNSLKCKGFLPFEI